MNINENRYTPVGKVQIVDAETNEVVYETHNMIVESGRKLINQAIFGAPGQTENIVRKINDYIAEYFASEEAQKNTVITTLVDFLSNALLNSNIVFIVVALVVQVLFLIKILILIICFLDIYFKDFFE
mgnify:CR=1 FL=1